MDFQGGDVSFIYDDVRCLLLLLCSCYYCTCMDFGMILIISTHPLFYIYIGEECDENDCVCVCGGRRGQLRSSFVAWCRSSCGHQKSFWIHFAALCCI